MTIIYHININYAIIGCDFFFIPSAKASEIPTESAATASVSPSSSMQELNMISSHAAAEKDPMMFVDPYILEAFYIDIT